MIASLKFASGRRTALLLPRLVAMNSKKQEDMLRPKPYTLDPRP